MERPLLLLSDTHISRDYGSAVSRDLARLIGRYPDAELVLNGDVIDLSLDSAQTCPRESLALGLAPHPELVQSLRNHVQAGGKVTLLPGNHDASLSATDSIALLKETLQPPNDANLEVSPWFCRRDNVHIEHGHLYDPDCAPNHPLADANPRSEGLGTALMRRFVSPNDALFFAHANQTTPASGLKTAIEKWGLGAPRVIYNYFELAVGLCLEGGLHKERVAKDKELGDGRLSSFAKEVQLNSSMLEELLRISPPATHHSFRRVFLRLYFDRIFAGLSLSTGLSLLAASGLALPSATLGSSALLTLLGGSYLAHDVIRNSNRYGDAVIGQLQEAAHLVRQATQSSLVVLGHSHVEVDEPGYSNLGSFGFPRGDRPYLLVSRNGKPERRHLSPAS